MMADAKQSTFTLADEGQLLGHLFDRHQSRLFALAVRMIRDREEAKDLVQDTFLRAARHLTRLPADDSGQEAWLVRVLVNLVKDRGRRAAVREQVHAGIVREGGDGIAVPPNRADRESSLVARETVRIALAQLPAKRRAVVVLTMLEERPTADVAQLLGMRPVTVRWHLSRARAAMAAFLDKESV